MAGYIGSIYTLTEIKNWYAGLEKPFFNPPNWIFGPVWTLLYILMGISFYIVWEKGFLISNKLITTKKAWNKYSERFWAGDWQKINIILIFFLQLALNIVWSIIFFRFHNLGLAFFELLMLWFSILYTIINFYRVSKKASLLLIPYILWVSFAGILNLSIWIINI